MKKPLATPRDSFTHFVRVKSNLENHIKEMQKHLDGLMYQVTSTAIAKDTLVNVKPLRKLLGSIERGANHVLFSDVFPKYQAALNAMSSPPADTPEMEDRLYHAHGSLFVAVPIKSKLDCCEGCAGEYNSSLCVALPFCRVNDRRFIFEKI